MDVANIDVNVDKIIKNIVLLVAFGTVGATIQAPGKLVSMYNNRIFRFIYFFAIIWLIVTVENETDKLRDTLIGTVAMLALYDLLHTQGDGYTPFFYDRIKKVWFP